MSCSSSHKAPQLPESEIPAIKVNGVSISEESIAQEVENHSADSLPSAIKLAAEALVVRELLLQKAKTEGFFSDDQSQQVDEETVISQLLDQQISTPKADTSECKAYFTANAEKFTSPVLLEASHILLAAAPDDEAKRAEQQALAQQLITTLKTQPELFVLLAQQHSACPSKDVGGSLGQLSKGSTVPEFEQFMFTASEGLFDQPIVSRYGIHVLRVDRRVEGEPLPFDAVEDKIGHYLNHQVYRRAISQYIGILAGEAEIEGIDINAAGSPLVQ
ncbi:MAG: peptidylprolyl isomerase [Halopseudomonas sp.]